MPETDAREAVLSAARALLATRGAAGVTMNKIVATSGVSKGGVYWHFASKDDILRALADETFASYLAAVDATLGGSGSASDQLRAVLLAAGRWAGEADPPPPEFLAMAAHDPVLGERTAAYFNAYRDRVAGILRRGVDAGEVRPGDPVADATTVVTMLEGVFLLGARSGPGSLLEQVNRAVDLLLDGLSPRASGEEVAS